MSRSSRRRLGHWQIAIAAAAVAAVYMLLTATPAAAHPYLVRAYPAPGSTVQGPVHTVTLTFTEGVTGSFSKFTVSTTSGTTVSTGATTIHGQTVVIPTVIDKPGKIVVSWLAVGTDFHPVRGQYLFSVTTASGGVPSPSGAGAPGAGFTQGTAGSPVWTSMIKAVRFVEVAALYAVLGVLLVRVLVLRGRLDRSEAHTAHLYAILLTAGFVSVVVAPMLFLLYASRLHDVSGVAVSSQVFSSVGRPWLAALVVWAGFTFAVVRFARRRPEPGDRDDLLLLVCAALATVVFVINTHAGAATPQPLWGAVLWAHVMVTALWAGSLGALVLVIVPSLGPAQGQLVIERFSTVMTLTVAAIPASGILLLLKLGGSWQRAFCSTFGVTAGFKVAVAAVALGLGAVNNRLIHAIGHRSRRSSRGLVITRRLMAAEAILLVVVLGLAAMLGETALPPTVRGALVPGEAQANVNSSFLGSGCKSGSVQAIPPRLIPHPPGRRAAAPGAWSPAQAPARRSVPIAAE